MKVKKGNARSNRLRGSKRKDDMRGLRGDDQLFGLAGNDRLNGGEGNDLLDGGGGRDRLTGGNGDDVYIIDDANDLIVEQAGQGVDTIQSLINITLVTNVENIILLGTQAINATGSADPNYIAGNEANNVLIGLGGNDTLVGAGGDDTLDGGVGADRMVGGAGNDVYYVDDPNTDIIEEAANGGIDLMLSTFGTLPNYVENLQLLDGFDSVGTGNSLNNGITGNAGSNLIDGRDGNDILVGGPGEDQLVGGAGADTFLYSKTSAFYISKTGADTITDYNSFQGDVVALSKQTFGLRSPLGDGGLTAFGDVEFVNFSFNSDQEEAAYLSFSIARLVYNAQTGRLFYNPNGNVAGFGPDNTGGAFTQILGFGTIQFVIVE